MRLYFDKVRKKKTVYTNDFEAVDGTVRSIVEPENVTDEENS